jgi:invasion protein IalB
MAFAASELPGGASSLRETYEDWTLNCGIVPAKDSTPASVACNLSQEQVDKDKRRIIALGLNPTGDGGVKGNFIMPFGLALAKGVVLQIDSGAPTQPNPFRTCLPAGCLVPVTWADATVKALAGGTTLKVSATSDDGQPLALSVSLKGFAAGYARAVELTK